MEPELRRALDELHALTKDNHRMLRAIRREYWFGVVGRIVIWVLVLALPLFLYQQYVGPVVSNYFSAVGAKPSGPFGLPTSADIQKLLDSMNVGTTSP